MSDEPRWTSEPPTKAGFYFHRPDPKSKASVVEFYSPGLGAKAGTMVVEAIGETRTWEPDKIGGEFWPVRIKVPPQRAAKPSTV